MKTKLLAPHYSFIKTLFDLGISQMDIHRQLIKVKKVKCCHQVNRSPTSIIKEFIRSLPIEKDTKDDRKTSSKAD